MYNIDFSIVEKAHRGFNFPTGIADAGRIGEMMWSGIPDGERVGLRELNKARDRFLANHAGMVPLVPPIPDELIRKAIFDIGNSRHSSGADYNEQVEPLRKSLYQYWDKWSEDVGKALMIELPDGCELKKALTAGSSNLMHIIADQDVTYLYKRPYPVQALIPTEANKGKTAAWDVIGPFDFGSAAAVTEDANLTESDITTYYRTTVVRYMAAVGRVTKAAQLAGYSQVPARDVLAIRIDAAQDALRALRERMMIGVNKNVADTTMAFTAPSALEYAGLYQLIAANTSSTTGDQMWISSTAGTYDGINKDLGTVYNKMVKYGMQPNLAICDYRTFDIYRRGLIEYFRTEPIKEFVQGVSKISLVFPGQDGLPLVPSAFMNQSAASGAIMLIDTRLFARRSLWQDMYEDLAKINLSQKFVISASETLIDKSDIDGTSSLQGGIFSIA